MELRNFISKSTGLMSTFTNYIKNSNDSRGVVRAMIAHQALNGSSLDSLANTYHVSTGSIRGWVRKIVLTDSWIALNTQPKTGRSLKLSGDQLDKIDSALQEDPKKHGFNVWDGISLSAFIFREYGINYSVRSCQYLFRKLGFTLVRPQVFPALGEEDRQDRRDFVEEIQALETDKIDVVWEDEVHFSNQTTVTRMWVKKGSEPKVKSSPNETSLPLFGFASSSTGEVYVTEPENGKFNCDNSIAAIRSYLGTQPENKEKFTVIILDRAPWHQKALRLIETNEGGQYSDILNRAGFILLPPRSPDLNPIEQLWRKIRREVTHNHYFETVGKLRGEIQEYLKKFEKGNEEMHNFLSFKNYWPKEEVVVS